MTHASICHVCVRVVYVAAFTLSVDFAILKQHMEIKIVNDSITRPELIAMAKAGFGDMVKTVVDLNKRIIACGGELHADSEAILLQNGSRLEDLWGINIYPEKKKDEMIEFTSSA